MCFLSQWEKNNLITCFMVHLELKGILLSNKVYLIGGKAWRFLEPNKSNKVENEVLKSTRITEFIYFLLDNVILQKLSSTSKDFFFQFWTEKRQV